MALMARHPSLGRLLPNGHSILVATSGGVDSMVLLHLLHHLARERRWRLAAAYFNHQLRPGADDADHRLVAKACARLRMRLIAGKWDAPRTSSGMVSNLEMRARLARHDFLAKAARQARASSVAMAHHADDQMETFFLQLGRGAGSSGLSGIPEEGTLAGHPERRLVRPLLHIRKQALLDFASTHSIAFREDASNATDAPLRNRVRHRVLPLLRGVFTPALDNHLLHAMEILSRESQLVRQHAEAWLKSSRRPAFARLAPALQRQVVVLQLSRMGVARDFERVEWLRGGSRVPLTVSPGVQIVRLDDGTVEFIPQHEEPTEFSELSFDPRVGAPEIHYAGIGVRCRILKAAPGKLRSIAGREYLDADKLGGRVTLRPWRSGDRFQPLGMPAAIKLQDLFTNAKVPKAERHRTPIATTPEGAIFWVHGLRLGEWAKVSPTTKRFCRWEWRVL